ncbi:hypothetical protein B0H66DRAFT_549768 [Apodospora peruviana]|uniref:Uncharacterized protein n=1 Tax=Apodospora peruviana TaxID=516989 RepID=A0AAE0MB16_9PEZI|nr:hypothetical protein B0H66DRAFT_549768 [Apodospora peruviana]
MRPLLPRHRLPGPDRQHRPRGTSSSSSLFLHFQVPVLLTMVRRQKCQGTCYQSSDPIASLKAVGDGTYGTNCVLFYDSNCQQQVGETGNSATGGGKCYTPPDGRTGHSFICWRKC